MNPTQPTTPTGPMVNPSEPAKPQPDASGGSALAADVIRQKIAALYGDEPEAAKEAATVEATPAVARSRHQQYMHQLTASGRTPGDIQAAWHTYYEGLDDTGKHEVWQEFYANSAQAKQAQQPGPTAASQAQPAAEPLSANTQRLHKVRRKLKTPDLRTVADIKQQITSTVNARGKLHAKHHLQSLFFGVGMGGIALFILLFGLFNERIIAPFITPSKAVSNTPIIIDPNDTSASGEPKVIIPKINVEIPVVYDQPSIKEEDIQASLEQGVVHYATTPSPGEQGNAVIFGHSSNNILNKGKYKFAFVLLRRLEEGDTFMLTKGGKRYVYRIYEKRVIDPTDISVLGTASKPSTVMLITCDPPGTTLKRLVVTGEQISPDPVANVASTAKPQPGAAQPAVVPSDAPSLWQRIIGWFTG